MGPLKNYGHNGFVYLKYNDCCQEIPQKVINNEELYDYFPDNLSDTDDTY